MFCFQPNVLFIYTAFRYEYQYLYIFFVNALFFVNAVRSDFKEEIAPNMTTIPCQT